ncbi:hypothetical protein K443DRAFT_28780, partial [Laccaria amethystina LaAM-08-1]
YNWLADSATTSHVCNRHEAFMSFHPLTATKVTGNVLYIPNNHNNLIALGKWDQGGRRFQGEGGVLTLTTKDGTLVAKGTKVENNLYKMKVAVCEPKSKPPKTITPQIFSISEPAQSWETWH